MENKEPHASLFRECLERRFPRFEESNLTESSLFPGGKIWVGYTTTDFKGGEDTTRIDLNVEGDVCYLVDIQLETGERGKGLGKALYQSVEEFATILGCNSVVMTPSGRTITGKSRKEYCLQMGYVPFGELDVRKVLN